MWPWRRLASSPAVPACFAGASNRIHVAHGYLLPDRGIIRAITAAARRGVQVRLLLAGWSDVPFARAATRSLYRRLLGSGVVIHEWNRSVLHAKVATVDGRLLLLGSFNLDPFSLANLEALVEVDDPRLVEQGEAWIQDHFAVSRALTSVEASSRVHRWLLDPLGRLVARIADMMSRVIAKRKRRGKAACLPRMSAASFGVVPVCLRRVSPSATADGTTVAQRRNALPSAVALRIGCLTTGQERP